ncbi:MAG: phospholipase D-like domain-containing protein [Ferruginibacter sp.]
MEAEFQVAGTNANALFTMKLHRGDGMLLLGMNWKIGNPPPDFVGFAIEYKEPAGDRFYALKNRLSFAGNLGEVNPNILSTRLSPVQKFRWVHFPRNADLPGEFTYRVTPVFMNRKEELSYGEPQESAIELRRETYPGQLNVCYTRGFVSSQAFVDKFVTDTKSISTLLPAKAADGLNFKPTHPKKEEAYEWMGFEARRAILSLLDEAIDDKKAIVKIVAYDLNEPELVSRIQKLGSRVQVVSDDSDDHGKPDSAETEARGLIATSAGAANIIQQHMGSLQHNKFIVVNGPKVKAAIGGSTNFSWRGFYVQSNNAIVVRGKKAIQPFLDAFEQYFTNKKNTTADFAHSHAATFKDLGLKNIDVKVAFSPHSPANALLSSIGEDIGSNTTSNLFFSLAFLYETKGPVRDAIKKIRDDNTIFTYGISDKKVGGLDVTIPDDKVLVVNPTALSKHVPEPFKSEPTGGGGTRMHHKFVVIDFNKPTARVYTGSYNFSSPADTRNGENLWLIRDRRIAVSYVVEALSMFDHYYFRILQGAAKDARKKLVLAKPPVGPGQKAWWEEDFTDARKILDRELFS